MALRNTLSFIILIVALAHSGLGVSSQQLVDLGGVARNQAVARHQLAAGKIEAASPAKASLAGRRTASGRLQEIYSELPLGFEPNQGQTDPQVKFVSRGGGYSLFLTSTEAVLALGGNREAGAKGRLEAAISRGRQTAPTTLRMKLAGANPQSKATGQEELRGKVNYFIGKDRAKWRAGVPTYAKAHYEEIYPGVDLVYYGAQRQLEYDFIVAPNADPKVVRLEFEGARKLVIDEQGDLVLYTAAGQVRQKRPFAYQEVNGLRRQVAASYARLGHRQIGFRVGDYDRTRPLIIDPVLNYSTYLGGAKVDDGYDLAVDASGNIYITGFTASTDFPLSANPYDAACGGCLKSGGDAFITKIDPSQSGAQSGAASLVYSTYLGGDTNASGAEGIAVDTANNIYVTGWTNATDFPTTASAFQPSDGPFGDGFVTKLNANGSMLLYSTYLAGNNVDEGQDIAVDSSGMIYVTGRSASTDFIMKNAYQSVNGGIFDVIVMKIDPFASGAASLLYSTFLGGHTSEGGRNIAVDAAGHVY
jgi:hypothetical protein